MCSFQRIAGIVPGTIFNKIFCGQVRNQHFGGITAVVRPVPIPNTAVKHCKADGSGCIASARVGSRQSFKKAGEILLRLFLLRACIQRNLSENFNHAFAIRTGHAQRGTN